MLIEPPANNASPTVNIGDTALGVTLGYIQNDIKEIKDQLKSGVSLERFNDVDKRVIALEQTALTKEAFYPYKTILNGMIGLVLLGFGSTVVYLVYHLGMFSR